MVLGGSTLLLVVLIDGQNAPAWAFLVYSGTCWLWFLAGVFAWWRRPSNGLGALLVLGGIALTLGGPTAARSSPLLRCGAVFATAILAVVVHLLHAFPSGRIRGRASRITVIAGYVVAFGMQIPLYAFNPAAAGLPVFIADRPGPSRRR